MYGSLDPHADGDIQWDGHTELREAEYDFLESPLDYDLLGVSLEMMWWNVYVTGSWRAVDVVVVQEGEGEVGAVGAGAVADDYSSLYDVLEFVV